MNSYKLGFGLVAVIAVLMTYFYGKLDKPAAISPAYQNPLAAQKTTVFSNLPAGWMPETNAMTTPPTTPDTDKQAALDPLLADIDSIMRELSMLQNQLFNPLTPYQSADEVMIQTYQPRIDTLSQRLEQQINKAKSLSKPLTQRFVWEQVLSLGLEDSASSLALSLISDAIDDTLFEDMLTTLGNSGYSGTARASLVFSILLPPETTYYDPNAPADQTPTHPATPRQQRIQQFLETQFQQETDPDVLKAYLDVYHTMSQDQHGLVPAERFAQQLEMLRARMAPDQYFSFRLQDTKLSDPNADIAGLLREISSTLMTPEQRQSLHAQLSSAIFISTVPNAVDTFSQSIALQHQPLLLRYLENSLTTPNTQDRYSLYEYGNQAYVIELLKHPDPAQAADTFYQRLVDSNVPEEQLAMLLGASMGGDTLLKRLQQNTVLRQRFENQLKQTRQPDRQAVLQEAIDLLKGEPLMLDQPLDAYGNPTYYPEEPGIEPGLMPYEPTPAPDSGMPAEQYPGY